MPKSLVDSMKVESNMPATHTYSLTVGHILLVKELHGKIEGNGGGCNRVSEGKIVRKAIELLAKNFDPAMFDEEGINLDIKEHPAFVPVDTARGASLNMQSEGCSSGVAPRRSFSRK